MFAPTQLPNESLRQPDGCHLPLGKGGKIWSACLGKALEFGFSLRDKKEKLRIEN